MKRRRLLVVGVVIGVVIAGFAIWFFSGSSSSKKPAEVAVSTNSHAPTAPTMLDMQSTTMLEHALNSSDKIEQAEAMHPALSQAEWSAQDLLPDGAKLTIDRTSFQDNETDGTVKAVVSGSVQAEFTLYLAPSSDKMWRVFATERTR